MNCPTGKIKYASRDLAEQSLWYIISQAEPGRVLPRRTYECEHCGCWHLTSREERDARSRTA